MSVIGNVSRQLADDPSLRWPGPHKGVVHPCAASITNACFDHLGEKPWRSAVEAAAGFNPEEVSSYLDLSYSMKF